MTPATHTAHTPGPWRAAPDETTGDIYVLTDDLLVARVLGHYKSAAMDDANARLIAAAPELLVEFGKAARDRHGHFGHTHYQYSAFETCIHPACESARSLLAAIQGEQG